VAGKKEPLTRTSHLIFNAGRAAKSLCGPAAGCHIE
jgi:hypothetical protein